MVLITLFAWSVIKNIISTYRILVATKSLMFHWTFLPADSVSSVYGEHWTQYKLMNHNESQ